MLQHFLTGIHPIHHNCRILSNPGAFTGLTRSLLFAYQQKRADIPLGCTLFMLFLADQPSQDCARGKAFNRSPVRPVLCADNLKPRTPMSDCGIPCFSAGPVVHPEYVVYVMATFVACFICTLTDAPNPSSSHCRTVSGIPASSLPPTLRWSVFIVRYPAVAPEFPPLFCSHILRVCNLRKNLEAASNLSDLFRAAHWLLAFASGRSGSRFRLPS